jgi:hypothetical protein
VDKSKLDIPVVEVGIREEDEEKEEEVVVGG